MRQTISYVCPQCLNSWEGKPHPCDKNGQKIDQWKPVTGKDRHTEDAKRQGTFFYMLSVCPYEKCKSQWIVRCYPQENFRVARDKLDDMPEGFDKMPPQRGRYLPEKVAKVG